MISFYECHIFFKKPTNEYLKADIIVKRKELKTFNIYYNQHISDLIACWNPLFYSEYVRGNTADKWALR